MKTSDKVIPCMVYSRVVGYYRPTMSFNKGKTAEWQDRHLIQVNVPRASDILEQPLTGV